MKEKTRLAKLRKENPTEYWKEINMIAAIALSKEKTNKFASTCLKCDKLGKRCKRHYGGVHNITPEADSHGNEGHQRDKESDRPETVQGGHGTKPLSDGGEMSRTRTNPVTHLEKLKETMELNGLGNREFITEKVCEAILKDKPNKKVNNNDSWKNVAAYSQGYNDGLEDWQDKIEKGSK